MIKNKLRINDSKTEFLILSSSFFKQQFNDLQINVGNTEITQFNTMRYYNIPYIYKRTYIIYADYICAFVYVWYVIVTHCVELCYYLFCHAALCYVVLYCVDLHCVVLYCIVLFCIICIVLYCVTPKM